MKLSILIPVYNERYYIAELIRRVQEVSMPYELKQEIIVVDDGSTDGTREVLSELTKDNEKIKCIFHERNQGKGAAIRTAIDAATGEFCIFQDADLEYDPRDYYKVLRPYVGDYVLEIGAGIGNITQKLMPRIKYIASDCDPAYVKVLNNLAVRRPGLVAKCIDATKSNDIEDIKESVYTVICTSVLEHIADDSKALANLRGALVKGGRLIILVPQGQWLYSSLDKAVGHVKRYSKDELAGLLRENGYEIEKMIAFNKVGLPGWILNGKLLKRNKMAKYQLKIYDSFVFLWRYIDAFLPWPGLSVIAVARKTVSS